MLGRHLTFDRRIEGPNLDSAFLYLQKAYKIDPQNPEVVMHCRNFYLRIGLVDIGNNFLAKSLELNPMDILGRRVFAWSLLQVGDLERSENEFKKIVEMNASSFDQGNLIFYFIWTHNLEAAKERLANLEKLDTAQFRFINRIIRVEEGNQDEALKLERPGPLIWSIFGMKREMLRYLDGNSAKPIPVQREISGNVAYSLEGLDKGPIWSIIRNEPEFKRIRERVKKGRDEKLRKYGSLD